jgi:hypothetical protein
MFINVYKMPNAARLSAKISSFSFISKKNASCTTSAQHAKKVPDFFNLS